MEKKEKIVAGVAIGGLTIGLIANGIMQIVLEKRRKEDKERMEELLESIIKSNECVNSIALDQTKILEDHLKNILYDIQKINTRLESIENDNKDDYTTLINEFEKQKQEVLASVKNLKNIGNNKPRNGGVK